MMGDRDDSFVRISKLLPKYTPDQISNQYVLINAMQYVFSHEKLLTLFFFNKSI
jgi:hypothetical protein